MTALYTESIVGSVRCVEETEVQVAEDLYLFVWREKIIPTLGVILIDLQQMRTDGKIMGYQGSDFGALSNFPVGASAKILNVTRHQE